MSTERHYAVSEGNILWMHWRSCQTALVNSMETSLEERFDKKKEAKHPIKELLQKGILQSC